MKRLLFVLNLSAALILGLWTLNAQAKIAFQKQVGSQRQIVVADQDGKNQKVISDSNLDTYHPDMGPEAKYVAYSRGEIQPGKKVQVEVVTKNLETNVIEVWSPKGDQYIHVEFSANGQYLAFSGPHPQTQKQNIFIVDLYKERALGPGSIKEINDQKVHVYNPNYEIIESDLDCYAPTLASDGGFVISHCTEFRDDKSAPKHLVYYDRGSKKTYELTDKTKHAMFPSLSVTEQYVTYVSKDSGQWDVYVMDLWTETTKKVTEDKDIEFTPVFGPNDEIYFTRLKILSEKDIQIDIEFLQNPVEVFQNPNVSLGNLKPIPFLADKNSDEYVISFSNQAGLSKTSLPDFPMPERSSFGSVYHKGLVYIAGGHQGPEHTYPKESFLNTLQVYNPSTKQWKSLSPMHESKHGFQMAAHENYLYVFGGFKFSDQHTPGWQSGDLIERYDITKDQWEILPVKLPRKRSSNALAKVGDKVYLLGGWDSTPKFEDDTNGSFHSKIDVFDLKTESVSTLKMEIPKPLRRALTAVVSGSEIYLLGGIGKGTSHFEWIDNVSILDTQSMTWSEGASLPFATFAPGAGLMKDKIYLTGGMILMNPQTFDLNYVDDIYVYDIGKDSWTHSGLYLGENKGFPQVVPMAEDALGILGGHTYKLTPQGVMDHPLSRFELIWAR